MKNFFLTLVFFFKIVSFSSRANPIMNFYVLIEVRFMHFGDVLHDELLSILKFTITQKLLRHQRTLKKNFLEYLISVQLNFSHVIF